MIVVGTASAGRGSPFGAGGTPPAGGGSPSGAEGTPPARCGSPSGAKGTPPARCGSPSGAEGTPPGGRGRRSGALRKTSQGTRKAFQCASEDLPGDAEGVPVRSGSAPGGRGRRSGPLRKASPGTRKAFRSPPEQLLRRAEGVQTTKGGADGVWEHVQRAGRGADGAWEHVQRAERGADGAREHVQRAPSCRWVSPDSRQDAKRAAGRPPFSPAESGPRGRFAGRCRCCRWRGGSEPTGTATKGACRSVGVIDSLTLRRRRDRLVCRSVSRSCSKRRWGTRTFLCYA